MAVDFKDYYRVLGVSRQASEAEIKQAFRKLARQYHPDVATDKKTAEEKFKEINEAHEVLSDPEKRRTYDELGADWQNAGAGAGAAGGGNSSRAGSSGRSYHFGGSTGFSDFFEQFFAGGGGGGGRGYEDVFRRARSGRFEGGEFPLPGSDIEGDILVTLEESLAGSSRSISLQHVDPETGEVDTETFTVRIPPGATEGRRIRVPGKGGRGSGGAAAGNLYLRVRLAAHPDFEAEGVDLSHEIDLAPWEAVLGTHVYVPTLTGRVKLRVPPGTSGGSRLRVRGHGLPKGASGERGDLYVIARIRVPTEITAQERMHWEQLARASQFNPRGDPS